MFNWKWWVGLLCWALQACSTTPACEVAPGTTFTGDGLIVLRRGQGQDGSFHMLFFPVCQLDTNNVVASLRHAGIGLSFYTDQWHRLIRPTTYGHVQGPFKEKMVTLTTTDPIEKNVHCWDCGLNEIFVIPVRIRLSDTLRRYPPTKEVHNYALKTQQGPIALRFRSTGTIVLRELSPR